MTISEKKWESLYEEMKRLGIQKEDLVEKFILGSGRGGQKINTSHTCVVLTHTPTQTSVRCQRTRNREENRFFARRLLCDKLAASLNGEKTERQRALEKKAKQKKRRRRRGKSTPDE